MDSSFNTFDDWAKVSCPDDIDDVSSSSSSAEVVVDTSSAKFLIRRDSSDSVEIMSMENDYEADATANDEDSTSNPGLKMCCSTCSTLMNQSLCSSMVHVKMEEIETQTENIESGNEVTPKKSALEEAPHEESQLEMTLDKIAEFIHHHGHQLIFIPTHLLFALLVLSAAHLTGIARIEVLEASTSHTLMNSDVLPTIAATSKSTITTSTTNDNGQTVATTLRELQSPEWLDRLSSLLDDVSSELAAVDSQISVVEKQLDLFDEQQQLGGSIVKQQMFVVDAYRQLVERQRQTTHLLDKINRVLDVDRQPRMEPPTLLDVRLKFVDLAGDFVQLNSRITEITFENRRRHINIVKKAASERHRVEAAFLASLVDRVRNSNAAQSVPVIDDKSASCRKLFRPMVRGDPNSAQDLVDCLLQSRLLAAETWRQMSLSLEQERLATIHYRNRALFAEMAISDLRDEVLFLNRTIYMQEQLQKLKEKQIMKEQQVLKPNSFLQCFSHFSGFSSFAELLSRPEHCATCDVIDRLAEQFVQLLNSISTALLNGTAKDWSTKAVLDMLGSTFQVLANSQPRQPIPVPTPPSSPPRVSSKSATPLTWSSRLRSKISSVKKTLSTAYDRIKNAVSLRGDKNVTISFSSPSVCPLMEANFERVRSRVEMLQHDRLYYDASILNALFKDLTSLQEWLDSSSEKCLNEKARRFLRCNLAWGHRMMRLFRWPVCSDRLPAECQFMPWQIHLMASIDQTSPPFSFEVSDNSTTEVKKPEVVVSQKRKVVVDTALSLLQLWQYFIKKPIEETPSQEQPIVAQFSRKTEYNKRGDDGSDQQCTYMFLTREVSDVVILHRHIAPSPPYYFPVRSKTTDLCRVMPPVDEQGPQIPALPAFLPAPYYSYHYNQPKTEATYHTKFLPSSCQVANNLKTDAFLNLVKRMNA